MIRHSISAAVVVVDTALLMAVHGTGALWVAALLAGTALLAYRLRFAAFAAALVLAAATGTAYALLVFTAYHAGRGALSRRGVVAVVGAAAGGLAVQLALRPAEPRLIPQLATAYLVFVALPVLVGRYLAQQERLMSALGERARLEERLRIARDMHDSLGRRLSLVSIQAAALEVTPLPAPQQQAVRRLAAAAREAMTEVYDVIGALRDPQGAPAIGALVAQFQAAGVPVTLRSPSQLPPSAGEAAYRVVEEGLTNAAKHAPGQPVTVCVEPEHGALLVTVANPAPSRSAAAGGGRGLPGLDERVRLAGGLLHHGSAGGEFRLVAKLPVTPVIGASGFGDPTVPLRLEGRPDHRRGVLIGVALAALIFLVLPASLLVGVGG